MRSHFARLAAGSAVGLALSLLPHAVRAADETVVTDVAALSQEVRTYIAKTGGEVMKEIAEAQKLTAGTTDIPGALRHTDKALALLHSVKAASPTESLREKIGGLLHHHRRGKAKAEQFVPVEGVLNEVSQIQGMDVADVETSLGKAKTSHAGGDKVQAEADLIDAYEGVGYLEIDLPLEATEARLTAARYALGRRDIANANAALAAAITHTKTWTAMAQGETVEAGVEY